MAYYPPLRRYFKTKPNRDRVINNLLALRKQISEEIPEKNADNNLLLGTWNIRDFGKANRRGQGERLYENLFYIAEIISSFDIVAVQEVNELDDLDAVMSILGPNWIYIATDVSDRRAGGNGERMTFLYDKRKVWFRNIAGEIVLPADLLISKVTMETGENKLVSGKQFRRTPYVVSFQSGWFKFDICTVHIYYGKERGDALKERIEEIEAIAKYLSDRANKERRDDKSLILLGDFNIVHPEHETMKALEKYKFKIPERLKSPTNAKRDKYYDQIAFKTKRSVIELENEGNAGVFDFYQSIYTEEHFSQYKKRVKETTQGKKKTTDADLLKYYKTWRTYQMSDHFPMWVRLRVNDSDNYLNKMLLDPK